MASIIYKGKQSLNYTIVTDDTTAVSGNNYSLNFSTAKTLTLPASPSIDDFVGIRLVGTANATIACNGNKIGGYANDKIIKPSFALTEIKLVYTGAINGWVPYIFETTQISANSQYMRAAFWDKFVHYYDFKRRRSDFYSSNAKDLLTNSSVYIQDTINGVVQDGVSLSGTSIRCASDSSFRVNTHSLICAFQTNHADIGIFPAIVSLRNSGNFAYSFIWSDTAQYGSLNWIGYEVSKDGTNLAKNALTNTSMPKNTGIFLHGYYDGVNVGLSYNGNTPNTSALTGTLYSSTSDFEIGGRNNSGIVLQNSRFYFVGLTNSVLTQSEISEIYNGGAWVKMPTQF